MVSVSERCSGLAFLAAVTVSPVIAWVTVNHEPISFLFQVYSPFAVTVTVDEPPSASKDIVVGSMVKDLPSCEMLTTTDLSPEFLIVTEPVRFVVVVFSARLMVMVCPGEPEVADNEIHESLAVAVHE